MSDLTLIAQMIPFFVLLYGLLRYSDYRKSLNQEKLAFELAITGKVANLRTAKQVVRQFWAY